MTAIELKNFNADNIIFDEPKLKHFSGGQYHVIPIKYQYEEGRIGELCVATNPTKSWGIQENRKKSALNIRDGPIEYYSLPLVIEDEETRNVLETIFQVCKDHTESIKIKIGKWNLLTQNMNPFYFKRDKLTGQFIEGQPPTLYPKLLTVFQKVRDPEIAPQIATEFYDANDQKIDANTLISKRCTVIAALTIKEIYIGTGPSIQLKINDVIVVEQISNQTRRLRGFFKKVDNDNCILDDMNTTENNTITEEDLVPDKVNKLVRRIPQQ